MPKYYRVRTQEQWEWLMNEISKKCSEARFRNLTDTAKPKELEIDVNDYSPFLIVRVRNDTIDFDEPKYFKDEELNNVDEVSDLMEESKMEDYVTIKGEDVLKIKNGDNRQSFYAYIDGLFVIANYFKELHIPKSLVQPKVKMTQAEKDEFDDIKKHVTALYNAMVLIFEHRDECINLNNKLFYSAPPKYLNDVQRDFARAWTDPSLIEVIPDKKWNVKVPPFERTNKYYYKFGEKLRWAGRVGNDDEDQQFTADELKEYGLEDESIYKRVEVEE